MLPLPGILAVAIEQEAMPAPFATGRLAEPGAHHHQRASSGRRRRLPLQ